MISVMSGSSSASRTLTALSCQGHAHDKGSALPRFALHRDGAAVELDQRLDDGEPEPGAALLAGQRVPAAVELLEEGAQAHHDVVEDAAQVGGIDVEAHLPGLQPAEVEQVVDQGDQALRVAPRRVQEAL